MSLFAHCTGEAGRPVDAALAWVHEGYPVFPCSRQKVPLTPRGYLDATTDPSKIVEWWHERPNALIGLPTGRTTGLIVLDLDRKSERNDGVSVFDSLRGSRKLPSHPRVATQSGGIHLYWCCPEASTVRCSVGRIGAGIDVRGDGGYVIVPQSPGYTVVEHSGLVDPPEWLLDLLERPQPTPSPPNPGKRHEMRSGVRRLDDLLRRAARAVEGERNVIAYWTACRVGELVLEGLLTTDAAIAAVTEAAIASGLPQTEAMRTATSGVTRVLREGGHA